MKTDSLFYRLFHSDPALIFELVGLEVPDPGRYRFHSQEVKQTAFRIDGVLEPPADQPDAPRLYLETQAQPDLGFYPRFLGEVLLHLGQYPEDRPWHAAVIYTSPAAERRSRMAEPFLSLPNLHRIYLNEWPLLDSANPRLWLLALFGAATAQLRPIVDKVQAYRAVHPEDGIHWLDLLETILVYKLPKLTREEIQDMFGLNYNSLKHTRFYQDVFEEGETKGKTKGEATLLLRQLERRFGPLPESARQRVAAADAETLLVWGERVLDAKALDDIWAP